MYLALTFDCRPRFLLRDCWHRDRCPPRRPAPHPLLRHLKALREPGFYRKRSVWKTKIKSSLRKTMYHQLFFLFLRPALISSAAVASTSPSSPNDYYLCLLLPPHNFSFHPADWPKDNWTQIAWANRTFFQNE